MQTHESVVLDSWAVLCYLEQEPGSEKVLEILESSTKVPQELLLCTVNWGEILYTVERRYGSKKRDEIEQLLSLIHLAIIPADQEITREAARLKASKNLPYADCFAAALAKLKKCPLVTGDFDFKKVTSEVKVTWLR